jgi:predicted acyltransferase
MTGRLISLDAFRGLTVAMMILVNNPGSWAHIYPPLRHARWHGWTPTDLVFPFFLFIVGVAISLSFARRVDEGGSRSALMGKVIRRTILIFLMGLFLNGFPFSGGADQWATLRLWGVLQRIALCYLIASLTVVLVQGTRGRILVTVLLATLYELGMRLPLVDGWGAGRLDLENNFVRWLDLQLWEAGHLYQGTGIPFDPEGLWSSLPAGVTTMLGFFTGEFLRQPGDLPAKLRRMAMAGAGAVVLGLLLHLVEPINKQLWTSSYVVVTAGWAWLLLAAAAWAIDLKGWHRWTKPAVVFGSNALVVFVGSGILARLLVMIKVAEAEGGTISLKSWLYTHLFASWAGPTNGSLLFAVVFILFWLAILWGLYARRWFIKV